VTISPGAPPTGSAHTVRPSIGAGASGVGSGLVNVAAWGGGIGVGNGEMKLGESIFTAWPIPARGVGPGSKVDNNDRTTSNEIF